METQPITELIATPVVSCSLKRKRPPMIEIPNVLQEIHTDKLKVSDFAPKNEPFFFGGIGVGVCSTKGKKMFMEDSHKIVSNKGFFGVYDGHGGHKAAEFVAENLHTNILEMMGKCPAKEEAVKAGYLKTDQEFLKQDVVSGACCVTALIEGQEIVVSNLGDCRAVLCRGGVAEALTKDHRAEREDERKRIENKGGYVEIHRGAWRVHGVLSVSRSIGDAHLKDWVVADPDTQILPLTSDMEFLVLASDGLWEEVGNQEAIDTVVRLCMPEKKPSFMDIQKDDGVQYGCVNVSPSSKLKRVSLVKQKGPKHSPRNNKTMDNRKDFPGENESLSSKLLRVPIVKKTVDNCKDKQDNFPSEDEIPPSKLKRVSLVKQKWLINLPNDKKTLDNCKYFPSENKSPLRVFITKKTGNNCKDKQDDFPSENESPPSKLRRISLFKQINAKMDSPPIPEKSVHKKMATSTGAAGLAGACKELVNLAVSRGSLDDITVMIVDLNHFRCKI